MLGKHPRNFGPQTGLFCTLWGKCTNGIIITMRHIQRAKLMFIVATMTLGPTLAVPQTIADDPSPRPRKQEALSRLQVLVGTWRGVGQPRRGSSRDSWIETAQWQWSFDDGTPALEFQSDKSRFYRHGRIIALDQDRTFQFNATRAGGDQVDRFHGVLDEDDQLTLTAMNDGTRSVARITIRTVADGDRLLMLLERRTKPPGRYSRIAEIGYTRKGSGFGQGSTQRECIVTGGLGSIAVTHKGHTYYVCCGGCRDLFEDDPEGVLADYRKQMAEKKKGIDEPAAQNDEP